MITSIKLFAFNDDNITRQEVTASATLNDPIARHVFIKHYIYNLVQVAAILQYSDRRTQADKLILKLVCDRLDRLFFGWSSLSVAAANYGARRPLTIRLPGNSKQATPSTTADAIVNTAFAALLREVPRAQSVIARRLMLSDVIAAKLTLIKFDVAPVEKLRGVTDYLEYNATVENSALNAILSDIDDLTTQYTPRRDIVKIFTAFNTLNKATEPTDAEKYDVADIEPTPDGIDTRPTAEPATEPATEPTPADDWRDVADIEPTPDGIDTRPTAELREVAAVLNIERTNINLPARKSAAFAKSKHEFNQAAQSLITYTLNNVIKDCYRRIKRGEIAMPTQYFLKLEPREILRAVGVTPSTVQARAIAAAVVTLYETPIKITMNRKTASGEVVKRLGYFHFIDYYETDADGNVTLLQISPYILTPGHPVNTAFSRFLPVDKAFNGGAYSIAADCTDVATVVNTLISDVKPGATVYWQQIFDTYKFSDSRDRRVKQKILATFAQRNFAVEVVNKNGFKFRPGTTTTDTPPTPTPTAKTAARQTSTTSRKPKSKTRD